MYKTFRPKNKEMRTCILLKISYLSETFVVEIKNIVEMWSTVVSFKISFDKFF